MFVWCLNAISTQTGHFVTSYFGGKQAQKVEHCEQLSYRDKVHRDITNILTN